MKTGLRPLLVSCQVFRTAPDVAKKTTRDCAERHRARRQSKHIRAHQDVSATGVCAWWLSAFLHCLSLLISSTFPIAQVRELKVRESENVALLGAQLLRKYRSQLREEESEWALPPSYAHG